MTSRFPGQSDYNLFVYGLAFIGLGIVSCLLSKDIKQRLAWIWLALFGFAYGVRIWLDLLAQVWQETVWLGACRWGLLAASFLFLAEFGRLGLVRQRSPGPGRWLLGILALFGCLGALSGWKGLSATTRYLGLIGGLSAGLALFREGHQNNPPGKTWLIGGGISLLLYSLTIGPVVHPAAFLPAAVLNFQMFTELSGLPARLPQSFLAMMITVIILGYLQATWPVDLSKSRRCRLRYMYGTVAALVIILVAGWILTKFLGNLALEQIRKDTVGRSNLIIQRLSFELEQAEAAARAMSGSPWLRPALVSKSPQSLAKANSVLDRYQSHFGASPAYILDRNGATVTSSNRNSQQSFANHNFAFRPYFQEAVMGLPSRYFAVGAITKKPGFFAAYPIVAGGGRVVGVAALKTPLDKFQQELRESDPAFLLDPHGVIFLSSRPSLDRQSLWPVAISVADVQKSQFGVSDFKPVFPHVQADGAEVRMANQTYLFFRQYLNTPATLGWSLVLLAPDNMLVFYRLVGVAATFTMILFTLLAAGSNLYIREGAKRTIASEARFRAMCDAAPEAVFVFDTATRKILDANPIMSQWLGYSLEELLNLKIDQLLVSEPLDKEDCWQCSAKLKPISCHRYRRKDGSLIEVECTTATLFYDHQLMELVFARNITERKRAEEALRDSEEKYRRLMETANDAIFTADLKSGIIVDANRKAAELLARPPEKLIGLHYSQLFSHEDAERYRDLFRQLDLKGGFIESDIQVMDSAGRGIPVEISTSRVKVGGRHLVTGIFRDISERQRAEEEKASLTAQLIQAQKIEAIGTLAGGIAHDFNNLLTGVLGNISLAMLDQEEDSPSRDRLTAAEKACLQAQRLARQLLTFAKGGAPIKELISLESLITETACLAAIGSRVKCKFNFPDSLWAAEVDPGQISQVFQNLVINAIQAMPAGGTITVQGENLEVGQQNELPLSAGRYVKIVVQDQGIGISPNYLPRVFDPYFTTKPGGNGLGLTTVYSIVRNHGGQIMVESSLGRGTTFQVFLPAVTREVAPRREENRQVSSNQLKILVMDDEEIVRDLLDKMLGHLGYRATLAKDGAEALELFIAAREAGENFSAVILDLTVPGGMGGKTALEQFLRIDPQIKAIVSSGYSDDPTMAEFAQNGFSGVITKPYRIAELSRVLNQVLANHLVITAKELS
ncbi:MAG: PAS domain S-box protein [Deltaproteobacteria bacterium]|nr:PAS domain S-box protein [Deltaproteobacteria bacterium]